MSVILILILASLGLAVTFLAAFVWAVRGGQYEDTCTPSLRVLMEPENSAAAASLTRSVINNSLLRGEEARLKLKPGVHENKEPRFEL